MINISLDKQEDIHAYELFHSWKAGGFDIGESIKADHPYISIENKKGYILDYYNTHLAILETTKDTLADSVRKTEDAFFKQAQTLFDNDYSDTPYQGILSIFNINPRYIGRKLFQIYYLYPPEVQLEVVYHEILHFIFFSYCNQNLGQVVNELDPNKGIYWDLSEITNCIILRLPQFQKIIGNHKIKSYPDHKALIPRLKIVWEKSNSDMKKYIIESLNILDNEQRGT